MGRERELAELVSACESGAFDGTHLFLISGEPGIGKTRLADEVALRAKARGMQVLWGRCWEGGGAPAYWPWIQVIRTCLGGLDPEQRTLALESEIAYDIIQQVAQIVPELRHAQSPARPPTTERLEPAEARFRLFDAVTRFLKIGAHSRPMLIILDDIHGADEASLALLRFFAAELKATPIPVIATHRDAEVERSHALSATIGEIARNARSIPMRGLSESEVRRFVEATAGKVPHDKLVARLRNATNGNPLFLEGIVRILVAESAIGSSDSEEGCFKIPVGVREAIRRQLDHLSPNSRRLLNVASAIGREFALDLCAHAAGVSEGDAHSKLSEAVRAGIVLDLERGLCRFAHALIRDAVYEELDRDTRASMHRGIATRLEEKYRDDLDSHAAELAHHFREANDSEKAIDYSLRAARAAYYVGSTEDCGMQLRAASTLTEGQNDVRRGDILASLGRLLAFNFNLAQGIAHLEMALEIFRRLKNEQKIATTNVSLGQAVSSATGQSTELANVPRALGHLRQAQAWKGEWPGRSDLGNLNFSLAMSLLFADRVDEAISAAKRATDEYKRHSYVNWIKAASLCARLLTVKGRLKEANALLEEVACVSQQWRHAEVFRIAMFDTGWCRILLRNPIEARRLFTAGAERKGSSVIGREFLFQLLVIVEVMCGNLLGAKKIAEEHDAKPQYLSCVAFREGNWNGAIEMAKVSLDFARRAGNRWEEITALWQLCQFTRPAGDLERAAVHLAQALRAYDPGDLLWEMRIRPEAVLIAIEMGRPDEALQHLEVCRTILAQGEDWCGMISPVERAEGIVAAVQGGDFAPHFERSIAASKLYSLRFDEADTLHDWGVALANRGEFAEANEKFDAAIEIYRRHGAGQRWIDRVEAARHSLATGGKARESKPASSVAEIFRREGEFWTIAYGAATFRLKDAKGLHYVAYLLARPGERLHVLDLIAAVDGTATNGHVTTRAESEDLTIVRDVGGAAPTIDARARSEYRTRLRELNADLDEAGRMNDLGRSEVLRAEIDVVESELTGSSGLGGRARAVSVSTERSRGLVGKNIRSALLKIRDEHPGLGRYFAASISTGYFCAYQPDPDHPISWQL